MKKRIVTMLMAGTVLLSGCNHTNISDQQFDYLTAVSEPENLSEETEREPITELMLAYDVNDSLNPYKMTTQSNLQLVPLLYDSLVTLDKRFEPTFLIADEITTTPQTCNVKVKRVQFSNGEILTPADVVYSANLAMNGSQKWSELLTGVSKVELSEAGDEVIFFLTRPNANFASLLTFPIVQQNTGEQDYR